MRRTRGPVIRGNGKGKKANMGRIKTAANLGFLWSLGAYGVVGPNLTPKLWGAARTLIAMLIGSTLLMQNYVLAAEPTEWIIANRSPEQITETLSDVAVSVESWVEELNQSEKSLICLGERHQSYMRRFLAESVFSNLKVDVLFLEADNESIQESLKLYRSGAQRVLVTGHDIKAVLDNLYRVNPQAKVFGVEPSKEQKAQIKDQRNADPAKRTLSRDVFIATNVKNHLQQGGKNVMLYGAGHCSKSDFNLGGQIPAFRHLTNVLGADQVRSAQLVRAGLDSKFSGSLMSLGFGEESTVFTSTDNIAPADYNHGWEFKLNLNNFSDIVLFER